MTRSYWERFDYKFLRITSQRDVIFHIQSEGMILSGPNRCNYNSL